MDLTSVTPGPAGLKALAHPVRIRILALLRLDGPATATSLARRLGLNSGATSYHLRQLAQHGFITDDVARGNGRERWWRAAHQATHTSRPDAIATEEGDTHEAYLQAVGVVYAGQLQRAIEQDRTLPEEWRRAGTFSDWGLRLTPARARGLREAIRELIEATEEDPEDTPGALTYEVNVNAYLHPDAAESLATEAEADAP